MRKERPKNPPKKNAKAWWSYVTKSIITLNQAAKGSGDPNDTKNFAPLFLKAWF